LDKKMTL